MTAPFFAGSGWAFLTCALGVVAIGPAVAAPVTAFAAVAAFLVSLRAQP